MYRKRDGSRGFSFTRFAELMIPDFLDDTSMTRTTMLFPLRKDMLYNYQLASGNFCALDKNSLYTAGVVDTEKLSKTAFKALQKHGILDTEGNPDTTKITPRFIHQVSMLENARQKDLINMLFWWEEECQRFRKLREEDAELNKIIETVEVEAADDNGVQRQMLDEVKFARERVRMKIRQVPSERRSDTEANTDTIMDQFRARATGAPMITANDSSAVMVNIEQPPEYGKVAAKKKIVHA